MIALLASLLLAGSISSENVVTLTDANFQTTVDATEYVLAEFYAPWCGHCKTLAPEFEKAATTLKENDATAKIILAKIDATEEKAVAEQFGVSGFPTLKWFVNGVPSDYGGGRTADTIVSWIKKKTGPAVSVLASPAELTKLKEDTEVFAVLVADAEETEFESAAKAMDTPFFKAIKPSADLLQALGATAGKNTIVVFKQFDELRVELAPSSSSADIIAFVEAHSLPLIVPFSQKTAPKIFGNKDIKQHFLLFVDEAAGTAAETLKMIQPMAEEYRGKYLFVSVDKTENRVTDFFGITDYPDARIVQMGEAGIKKFKLVGDGAITAERIKKTIEGHTAGSLSADLKSEEVPETNDGDIKVLVGKNFNDIVKQAGKDVLVEFYAPWCGHCKELKPKYEELGVWAKDKDNLVIAMMDASQNEVDGIDVSSFPTLKLFKADSDEIIDYDDERELDNMINFLEKNADSCKM